MLPHLLEPGGDCQPEPDVDDDDGVLRRHQFLRPSADHHHLAFADTGATGGHVLVCQTSEQMAQPEDGGDPAETSLGADFGNFSRVHLSILCDIQNICVRLL